MKEGLESERRNESPECTFFVSTEFLLFGPKQK